MDETRRSFLRMIAEFPDDDTPRLVYADWLRERGEDKHADLIEVSCELADFRKLAERASSPLANPDRVVIESMEARERKLITLVEPIYGSPSPPGYKEMIWDRGFIVSFEADSNSHIIMNDDIFQRHPVHTIRLLTWHGVEKSFPPNPREVMWSLKRVEIPRSFTRYSSFFGVYDCFGVTRKGNNTYRWYIDCIPGVEVKFWDNGNPYEGLSVHASH